MEQERRVRGGWKGPINHPRSSQPSAEAGDTGVATPLLLPRVQTPVGFSGSAADPSRFTGRWRLQLGDALKDDALKEMQLRLWPIPVPIPAHGPGARSPPRAASSEGPSGAGGLQAPASQEDGSPPWGAATLPVSFQCLHAEPTWERKEWLETAHSSAPPPE